MRKHDRRKHKQNNSSHAGANCCWGSVINDITSEESTVRMVLEDEDVSILTFECSEIQID